MLKKILITSTVVMAVLAVAFTAMIGYASAQTPDPTNQVCPNFVAGLCTGQAQGMGGGRMMGGRASAESYQGMGTGMMGRRGGQGTAQGDGLLHTYMVAAFAEAFDMTPEALQTELNTGTRMYDIAVAEGYTAEQFTELMTTTRTTALEQAVAAGTITQEQADWMLQRWETRQANGYGAGNCTMRTAPAIP